MNYKEIKQIELAMDSRTERFYKDKSTKEKTAYLAGFLDTILEMRVLWAKEDSNKGVENWSAADSIKNQISLEEISMGKPVYTVSHIGNTDKNDNIIWRVITESYIDENGELHTK